MIRLRVETILAAMFAMLAVVTMIWPNWIEILGFDPDHGDGSAEWAIVMLFGVVAAVSALLARHDLRRLRDAGSSSQTSGLRLS
jgi:hypothetical protein